MPNANDRKGHGVHAVFAGDSGVGKSTLAYYAPQPIAALLLDKSSIDVPPGVDAKGLFFKTYPPAVVNLLDDKHGRARNIADAIISDIQVIRDHFTIKKPLKIRAGFEKDIFEEWPTPATVILEGADFLNQHIVNLVCARAGKMHPADFGNKYEAWGLRTNELHNIYDILTYLPCNVVVTTGLHTDEDNGGLVRPSMGGAMNSEGPRKFHSCLHIYASNGKHYARIRSNVKYQGFKLGGGFAVPDPVEITVDGKSNPWEKLFGVLTSGK